MKDTLTANAPKVLKSKDKGSQLKGSLYSVLHSRRGCKPCSHQCQILGPGFENSAKILKSLEKKPKQNPKPTKPKQLLSVLVNDKI